MDPAIDRTDVSIGLEKPRVLYVGGYGRSGSSIIGLLLGSSEDSVHCGALGRAHWALRASYACTCGQLLPDCPFWSSSDSTGLSDWVPAISSRAIVRRSIQELPVHAMRMSGASVIVDSSKTGYRRWLRPLRYRFAGYDVRLVHVVRSPHAVVESARKGRNSDLEQGVITRRPFEVTRTLLSWSFANLAASVYRIVFGRRRYIRVLFEDFLSNPAKELRRIGKLAGLNFESVIEKIESAQDFDSGHEIAGNRLLRSGPIKFSARVANQEMPWVTQHAFARGICNLLSRLFYRRVSGATS